MSTNSSPAQLVEQAKKGQWGFSDKESYTLSTIILLSLLHCISSLAITQAWTQGSSDALDKSDSSGSLTLFTITTLSSLKRDRRNHSSDQIPQLIPKFQNRKGDLKSLTISGNEALLIAWMIEPPCGDSAEREVSAPDCWLLNVGYSQEILRFCPESLSLFRFKTKMDKWWRLSAKILQYFGYLFVHG